MVAKGSVPASEIPDVAIVGTVFSLLEIVTLAEEGSDGVGLADGGPPEPVHAATTVAAAKNAPIPASRR